MGQKIFNQLSQAQKDQLSRLIKHQDTKEIIKSKNWILRNGKYRKLQFKKIFSLVKHLPQINQLDFRANNQPTIPLQIAHLKFKHLIQLDLSGNSITSLESLQFLDMMNLEHLDLSWNFIRSLSCLHKTNLRQLKKINFLQNHCVEFNNSERLRALRLRSLALEGQTQQILTLTILSPQPETISNIVWLVAKMELNDIYLINIQASQRIKFKSLRAIKVLKCRLINLTFKRRF